MTVQAYAALQARAPLQPFSYEPAPLGPHDIEIEVHCCGLCHSDVHLVDDDWGVGHFPLVPGHEIVGEVSQRGEEVQGLEPGQRVGVGWQRGACLQCDACLRGEENLCLDKQHTCMRAHGGFADRIRVDARFAFAIPAALPSSAAAPLLCGGVTVYAPLARYARRPGARVGVIGIGGLGHLALKFARVMGCEVTAFSRSADKEGEARGFGAHRFVVSSDKAALKAIAGSLDLLISTVAADLDWATWLKTLAGSGTLVLVGGPSQPLTIPATLLISQQRQVAGSVTGGRPALREMLAFAARHQVAPQIQSMPMAEVNDAIEALRQNRARYRIVLTRDSERPTPPQTI